MLVASVRILLVEDFEPWRRSVRSTLKDHGELRLVDEVGDGLEAVRRACELKPDLILLDIGIPSLNGIEAARRIRQAMPDIKIIFLSQINDCDVVQAALNTGAHGYVLKSQAGRELLPAVAAVLRGDQFVGSGLASSSGSSRPLN